MMRASRAQWEMVHAVHRRHFYSSSRFGSLITDIEATPSPGPARPPADPLSSSVRDDSDAHPSERKRPAPGECGARYATAGRVARPAGCPAAGADGGAARRRTAALRHAVAVP
jgi:hypothetical protein